MALAIRSRPGVDYRLVRARVEPTLGDGHWTMTNRLALIALPALALVFASACTAAPKEVSPSSTASPLKLKAKIALPDTKGRIDHFAYDPVHGLLFVAEYGNGTVDEVDLAKQKPVARVSGLREPQGLAVTTDGTQLAVASGDGSVRFYSVPDLHPLTTLDLGDDADDARVDPRQGHIVIGYGEGGLAVIDPATHRVVQRLLLPAHPEGFQLDGSKVFVNVPDRGLIVVGDIDDGQVITKWPTGLRRLNFPLAMAPDGARFALAYRLPAAIEVRDASSGTVRESHSACGDADDLFIDGGKLYVVCGAGHVEVMDADDPGHDAIRVETASGARTGLLVPSLDTLFVAVPARHGAEAAIWELRTNAKH